jgi:hypothetical protein
MLVLGTIPPSYQIIHPVCQSLNIAKNKSIIPKYFQLSHHCLTCSYKQLAVVCFPTVSGMAVRIVSASPFHIQSHSSRILLFAGEPDTVLLLSPYVADKLDLPWLSLDLLMFDPLTLQKRHASSILFDNKKYRLSTGIQMPKCSSKSTEHSTNNHCHFNVKAQKQFLCIMIILKPPSMLNLLIVE